jgi:antitoxin CptB
MKELDLLLLRYVDRAWPAAGEPERAAFEQLLDLPDPELAAYLLGHEIPPASLAPLVDRLRAD